MQQPMLDNINNASGATDYERELITALKNVYTRNLPKHEKRRKYYEDKTQVSFVGINLKDDFAKSGSYAIGWVAKSVDFLASRSRFDSFVTEDEEISALLSSAIDIRKMKNAYSRAVPTQLVDGFGMWTVIPTADGKAKAKYYGGHECAALWDYSKERIKAALVIDGYEVNAKTGVATPDFCLLMYDGFTAELVRVGKKEWSVSRRVPNAMGRPMAVPMVYKASFEPLGKSRVTPAAMRITDEMQREKLLNSIHSRKFSLPKVWMTNASDSLIDAMDKSKVYNDEMVVIGKDEDGETVTIGQLAAASPNDHIAQMDKLAREMAAEASLPTTVFGGDSSKTYVSSDSLRAANDEIIMEARDLNNDNADAMRTVAQMVVAVVKNKPLEEIADKHPEWLDIDAHFADPAMPSDSQTMDALTKLTSMAAWLPETEIFWEWAGKPEDERKRVLREKESAQQLAIAASVFGA